MDSWHACLCAIRALVIAVFALQPAMAQSAAGNIVVAIAASGADATVEEIKAHLLPGRSLVDGGRRDSDDLGQGTTLAILISGTGSPCAALPVKLLPLQIAIKSAPDPAPEILVAAIEEAVAANADVLLLAVASARRSGIVEAALDRALGKGMVILAPAGSSPDGFDLFPASHPGVCSVAGVESMQPDSVHALGVRLAAFGNASSRTDVFSPSLDRSREVWGSGVAAARAAAFAVAAMSGHPEISRKDRREWLLRLGERAGIGRAFQAPPRLWNPEETGKALEYDSKGGGLVLVSISPFRRRVLRARIRNFGSEKRNGVVKAWSRLQSGAASAEVPELEPGAAADVEIDIGEDICMIESLELFGDREGTTLSDAARFSPPIGAWANDVILAGLEVTPLDEGGRRATLRAKIVNLAGERDDRTRLNVWFGGSRSDRPMPLDGFSTRDVEFDLEVPETSKGERTLPLLVELSPAAGSAGAGGKVLLGDPAFHLEPQPGEK